MKYRDLLLCTFTLATGCAHLGLFMPPVALPAEEQVDWPAFGTPTEVEVGGDLFRVIKVAADDFIPSGLVGNGETPAERCTSSQAAHYYRVVHAPEKHLYFIRMGLDRECAGKVTDWGAEYAIDDRTWKIRGRRIGSNVPASLGPELAALVITECPSCDAGRRWFDFGYTGRPLDHTFYLRNTGAKPAMDLTDGGGLAGAFSFKGGSYPGAGGTCGGSLEGGSTCALVVTFDPAGTEPRARLTINYDDGFTRRDATISLSGIASPEAHLVVSAWPVGDEAGRVEVSTYEYGPAGISLDHTFYVQNTGAANATRLADDGGLTGGFAYRGGAYPGAGGTCGTSLAGGERCTVVVTFSPAGLKPSTGTLRLTYHDGSAQQVARLALEGTATTKASLSILDFEKVEGCGRTCGPFDFGTVAVGASARHAFVVVNRGAADAAGVSDGGALSTSFGYAGGHFPGEGGDCGGVLRPGERCTVVVQFSPDAVTTRAADMVLDFTDAQGQGLKARRSLRGTGR